MSQNFDPKSVLKRLDEAEQKLADMESRLADFLKFRGPIARDYSGEVAGTGDTENTIIAGEPLESRNVGTHSDPLIADPNKQNKL